MSIPLVLILFLKGEVALKYTDEMRLPVNGTRFHPLLPRFPPLPPPSPHPFLLPPPPFALGLYRDLAQRIDGYYGPVFDNFELAEKEHATAVEVQHDNFYLG